MYHFSSVAMVGAMNQLNVPAEAKTLREQIRRLGVPGQSRDKIATDILSLLKRVCNDVIGPDVPSYIHNVNSVKAVQRQTLNALLKGEKDDSSK